MPKGMLPNQCGARSRYVLFTKHFPRLFCLDGEEHEVMVGQGTIQDAAVQVLKYYQTNFSLFNPYAEQTRTKGFGNKGGGAIPNSGFKIYDFERGGEQGLNETNISKLIEVAARQSAVVHNELYGHEVDKEKRVGKKKYRLIAATEEAFAQLQSINEDFVRRNVSIHSN
jgi:vang-like